MTQMVGDGSSNDATTYNNYVRAAIVVRKFGRRGTDISPAGSEASEGAMDRSLVLLMVVAICRWEAVSEGQESSAR